MKIVIATIVAFSLGAWLSAQGNIVTADEDLVLLRTLGVLTYIVTDHVHDAQGRYQDQVKDVQAFFARKYPGQVVNLQTGVLSPVVPK